MASIEGTGLYTRAKLHKRIFILVHPDEPVPVEFAVPPLLTDHCSHCDTALKTAY